MGWRHLHRIPDRHSDMWQNNSQLVRRVLCERLSGPSPDRNRLLLLEHVFTGACLFEVQRFEPPRADFDSGKCTYYDHTHALAW